MTEQLNEISNFVDVLQGTTDEIDAVLLDEGFLSERYTANLSELRQRLEVLRQSIKSFSEQVTVMKEETDEF